MSIGLSEESEEIFDFKEDSLQKILSASPPFKVLPKAEMKKRPMGYSYLMRIAAILVLVVGVAFIIRQQVQNQAGKEASLPVVHYITKENPSGQKIKFQLPDRSIVWLNAESKLTFPEKFVGDHRTVELEGEAFFEIEEDTLKPFHIQKLWERAR